MAHILILNPWHGGSHKAVVEGWQRHSEHRFTVLGLEPRNWKWRMRHGAWTLAEQAQGIQADVVWTTDMLDVATWRALAPRQLKNLPTVVYMHEHQAGYPDGHPHAGDLHFAITNITSAAAADGVWFNSRWHLESFCENSRTVLRKMPDYRDANLLDRIAQKSMVMHPGWEFLHTPQRRPRSTQSPPHLLMAARWQGDKGLDLWEQALDLLMADNVDFRVSCIGGHDGQNQGAMDPLRKRLGERVVHWGHLSTRENYEQALHDADIMVSTADHEFFGIAMVEGVAAGCLPCVPKTLAYPEVLADLSPKVQECTFHDGTPGGVLHCLKAGMDLISSPEVIGAAAVAEPYHWLNRAPIFDKEITQQLRGSG